MLQAWALQKTVANLGHSVEIIDYYDGSIEAKNRRKMGRFTLRNLLIQLLIIFMRSKFNRRFERFEKFKHERMWLTRRYVNFDDLKNDPPVHEIFVSGSDQVFNMDAGGVPAFFLQFVPDGRRRVSYAPSFGSGHVPECFHPRLRDWLLDFDFLSVRETSGQDIIETVLGKRPDQVVDPAFLLSGEEWSKVAVEPQLNSGFIAFYSLEVQKNLTAVVEALSKHFRLPIVVLGKGGAFVFRNKILMAIDSGPREFLGFIKNARFVISNSFHSLAFSIIFERPFAAFPHSRRNARIESLLELTGLQDRAVDSTSTLKNKDSSWFDRVDWTTARRRLAEEREVSLQYLKKALAP